ncbi:sugar phosphate nucleotidyltransferase [Dyadobacter psychrotolerans]|uniref:NDP-sugar synthase n=1 Tax=Dyadobacter psychrotolerans TaxID=2541721 RepID=A0A4R5DHB4_9BACT|nr:sugar phosphate nucleotidyltransferase [Dyadobacter psychrotolerans]TDE11310.1 NDP-sugar synthase [Dyadobacter psychrotolerans]
MNYAIIAAGEGSRLAKEGFSLPKPMVSLHGEMLIDRLISVFTRNNAEGIYIIINEESEKLDEHLSGTYTSELIRLTRKSTPSSLHSFYELLKTVDQNSSICLTTTDTVFKEAEFKEYIAEFLSNKEIDGLMAVTTFIDDESPLFVEVDSENNITAFADKNDNQTQFISGGIYCLRGKALQVVTEAVENGTNRMRNFQRQLLENDVKLKAYPFSKIVDVDHMADIVTAENFLKEENEMFVTAN